MADSKLNSQSPSQRIKTLDVLNRLLKISRPRKELAIILTHRCNLSCAYCLRGANSSSRAEIPYHTLKKIITTAHRFRIRNAGIPGGEPFLYSHWQELVKLLGPLKWRVFWETNGFFVNKKNLWFLKKNLGNNIAFLVSLDSHKEKIHDKLRGKGSFKKALKAIKLIKSYDFSLQTNVVLTSFNIMDEKDLVAYVRFNKNLGVNKVSFNKAVNLGRGSNQKFFSISDEKPANLKFLSKKSNNSDGYLRDGAFRSIEDDNGCERLGSEICVSPFGVHPCVFQENIKLGELKDFSKIFFNRLFLKTLNILRLASMSGSGGEYFNCAECVELFADYLKKVKQLELISGIKAKETM